MYRGRLLEIIQQNFKEHNRSVASFEHWSVMQAPSQFIFSCVLARKVDMLYNGNSPIKCASRGCSQPSRTTFRDPPLLVCPAHGPGLKDPQGLISPIQLLKKRIHPMQSLPPTILKSIYLNKSDGKNCFKLSNTIESIPQYCPKNHTVVRKTFFNFYFTI